MSKPDTLVLVNNLIAELYEIQRSMRNNLTVVAFEQTERCLTRAVEIRNTIERERKAVQP